MIDAFDTFAFAVGAAPTIDSVYHDRGLIYKGDSCIICMRIVSVFGRTEISSTIGGTI